MNEVIFQRGKILVTGRIFKTARRTYKIQHIERIHIRRPWFLFCLPLSPGCYFLLSEYGAYLYQKEIYACVFVMLVLPLILFNIGTLSVTAKSYSNDPAVTGFFPALKATRTALEKALYTGKESRY